MALIWRNELPTAQPSWETSTEFFLCPVDTYLYFAVLCLSRWPYRFLLNSYELEIAAAKMFSSPRRYILLADDKDVTEERDSAAQDMHGSTRKSLNFVLLIALVLSFILNTFFLVGVLRSSGRSAVFGRTAYGTSYSHVQFQLQTNRYTAHLATDAAVSWTHKSPYWGEDEARADQVWADIGIDDGIVALPDSYVESMGLPTSVRFPLDQDKGIYVLNGFHGMHCLVCGSHG